MKIHKYLLYLIVNILVFVIFLLPRFYRLALYETTLGTVTRFDYHEAPGKYGTRIWSRPVVEFQTERYLVTFTLPNYMKEMVNVGSRVLVMYDSKNPENAYVKNFYSIW